MVLVDIKMGFSDLLDWHEETMEKEKKGYEAIEKFKENKKKIKLTLILTGVAFLIYGSIFASRWINATPVPSYGASGLTGMATAPVSQKRVGEIRMIGMLGLGILIGGVFILGIGTTMPANLSFKDLFEFK